ncbi:hypothetical protein B0H21DRAFT_676104, partial [Amylocystis lapponica]
PWDVYSEKLFPLGHGLPLWHPDPTKQGEVLPGDVGFVYEGQFIRFFNATLPATHHINERGVPDDYEPLDFPHFLRIRREGALPRGPMCSRGVTSVNIGAQVTVNGVGGELQFASTEEQAALLVLEESATKDEYRASPAVKNYVRRNWRNWYNFASQDSGLRTQ